MQNMSTIERAKIALETIRNVWLAYPHDCRLEGPYGEEVAVLEKIISALEPLDTEYDE